MYRHEQLRDWLSLRDYSVYPRELLASRPWNNPFQETTKNYGYIDVAAHKNWKYYGFEYKGIGDKVSRAIHQCEAYILTFDYVIVVCERNLTPRSKYWMILEDMGIGIWRVTFTNIEHAGITQPETFMAITEKLKPKLQSPEPARRNWVEERFHRYVWKDFKRKALVIRGQKQLTDFHL